MSRMDIWLNVNSVLAKHKGYAGIGGRPRKLDGNDSGHAKAESDTRWQ